VKSKKSNAKNFSKFGDVYTSMRKTLIAQFTILFLVANSVGQSYEVITSACIGM